MEYPVRFDVSPGETIEFVCNYYRRHCSDGLIRGVLENFKTLLEAVAENPGQTVGELMKLIRTDITVPGDQLTKLVKRIQ